MGQTQGLRTPERTLQISGQYRDVEDCQPWHCIIHPSRSVSTVSSLFLSSLPAVHTVVTSLVQRCDLSVRPCLWLKVALKMHNMPRMIAELGCRAMESRRSGKDQETVGSPRAGWRIIARVEHNDEQQAAYAREYVMKVEAEILEIRDGPLGQMDRSPILSASTREWKVF